MNMLVYLNFQLMKQTYRVLKSMNDVP